MTRPSQNAHGTRSAHPLANHFIDRERSRPMEPEEERKIAIEYRRTNDPRLGDRLVEANLRLVFKMAYEHDRSGGSLLPDLVQEGSLGLVEAVRRFDPGKGVRLATYAGFWIRAFMMKHLMDNARLVRVGRTREDRAAFFRGVAQPAELSLDALSGGGETGTSLVERLADPGAPADALLEMADLARQAQEQVTALDRDLDERERTILRLRLLADEPVSLRAVAARFSLSGERVRQIEKQLQSTLRRRLAPAPEQAAA